MLFEKIRQGAKSPPKTRMCQLTSVVLFSIGFLDPEEGTKGLSQNVCKELPLRVA
jgi:hypothetical protein